MNKKGLITLEACLLIALVAAALFSVYPYMKRAIQGNWRKNADSFSDEQYDPEQSIETASDLKFISPTMGAIDTLTTGQVVNEAYALANRAGIIQIPNWGTYYDGSEHEEE